MALPISHGFVLPDKNFEQWLQGVTPYMQAFERVAVIRGPAGNDLNRFRNITAVQVPGVWFGDDALKHIRRAYPLVVLIDVIRVNTAAELKAVLQTRINARDRFGQKVSGSAHIDERFTIQWPTKARPAQITRKFSADTDSKYEGLDIATYTGAEVFAGAPGTVTAVGSGIVQITSVLQGQTYITTYTGLIDIKISIQKAVATGDLIGHAASKTLKLVVQTPGTGLSGFNMPDVMDPTLAIYWQGMRLRPIVRSLRVRDKPGAHGDVIGTITPEDSIETEEPHGRTLAKLGVENEWLRIRRAGSHEAYTAAWFLEAFGVDDPPEGIPGIALPGMNIDIDHPRGLPDAAAIRKLGWVRLKFNVSFDPRKQGDARYGNTDVDYAYSRYQPLIQRYLDAGLKIILILTHQTYGEGQGFVWPQMDSGKWHTLSNRFAEIARKTAQKFAGKVAAYQVWNEQDTKPEHARAAVPIPASDYAYMLTQTMNAIRSADPGARIITGGHVGGPVAGADYARRTLASMPASVRPDGIAFHPYGRGPAGNEFSIFGPISESIQNYGQILPGKPVWITEWGVLDRQHQPEIAPQVSQYADGFMKIIRAQFPGRVAAAVWYAWADSMDNGYGLVRSDGQPKQPLYDLFLK